MDTLYENIELTLTTDHSQHSVNLSGSGKQFTPVGRGSIQPDREPQSTSGLETLYKRTSAVFISLWIITLIILIARLSVLFLQKSALQNELDLQWTTSINISAQQISNLQNEVKELLIIAEDGFAKWTNKQGIVRQEVWKWIRKAAANVILDPRTAHRNLTVSEDGKQVRFSGGLLPGSPLRFSNWYGIQGKESFSSGRHYYEVQVGTRDCFSVGFVKESVEKMKYTVTSESGFLMFIIEKNVCNVSTTPPTSLSLNEPPNNVGVYVDYDKGQVSFYNVGTRSHIYSFTGYSFSEKLYPAVNPCNSMTSGPLIISPVSHTD
ncbi:butyrophilin subfamily 3 member A3-like [Brienomyrus brachyistius]|uniref:butyrophilin subfamily 3 member A3-like n=1 Tax=Brienomyrus brachyistius TaxID=42636 RepID=UPI0020B3327F|nr:butyrophilin subfamily 3 member A3-like [Brienomyrus brachyistius]